MPVELKIFGLCCIIQCGYYLIVFARLNFVRPLAGTPEWLPPVSVIICAKNEADNLQKFLKVVLIQQYRQYEVIVVNDQSTDHTSEVLVHYYVRNPHLKIVNITGSETKQYAGKKHALLKGIAVASFDTLILTDADCRPASTLWLAKMAGSYLSETKIVLGHSPFEKQAGLLNKLIRYENFMTAIQYLGFAKLGIPYMGIGRNLSYTKDLVQPDLDFEKYKQLPTGDDDLLINAKASGGNTEICIAKEAFVYSTAPSTLSGWLKQKRRHLRAGFHYKLHHKTALFLFSFSGLLFYVLWAVLLVKLSVTGWAIALFATTLLVKYISTAFVYRQLGAADLQMISPVLDVMYTLYLLIIFFLLLLKPKDSWKT